jgi:hypothetical protein
VLEALAIVEKMAIKGKKKQQSRGSQARRRPAAAPRAPVVVRRPPWYRTDRGRAIAAMVAIVVLVIVWWAVADARAEAARLDRAQARVEDYTGSVRSLLQRARPAVEGMGRITTETEDLAGLEVGAGGWIEALELAQLQTQGSVETDLAVPANRIYGHALAILANAARTYELVPDAEGRLQERLLERAAAQRDTGTIVWLTATDVLDSARERLGLGPSGISPLATPDLPGAAPVLPGMEGPVLPGGGGGEAPEGSSGGDGETDGGS